MSNQKEMIGLKKLIGRVLPLLVALAMVFVAVLVLPVDAQAATKKKKTATPSVTAEEEAVLAQLVAYRDALVKAGVAGDGLKDIDAMIASEQALITQKQAQAAALAEYQKALEKMNKDLAKGSRKSAQGVIFVGDSRTCQMHDAVGETGAIFIAEYSMGYNWLKDTAIPKINNLVAPGVTIVFNLGVNDPGNIDRYISLVNSYAYQWALKGAKVYYATVNPIWDNDARTNVTIDGFNAKLVTGLVGVGIIDTNSYLKTTGYKLIDNWHFDAPTNSKIYLYIMSQI